MLSATELIDAYCVRNGIRILGLLGSPPVLETHLFGLLKVPQTIIPEPDQGALVAAYMQVALQGYCDPKTAAFFIAAGETMVREHGAEGVLLAGTDFGLVFDARDVGYRIINALDIHVGGLL